MHLKYASKILRDFKITQILLSQILQLFINIGFEHINIIEHSCRYIDDEGTRTQKNLRMDALHRAISFTEKSKATTWRENNAALGVTLRKNKTKANRRKTKANRHKKQKRSRNKKYNKTN